MTETDRRTLANELAAAGFALDYLAHRYDLPDPDTLADTTVRTVSGHDRGGQRQLSAPDTRPRRRANDAPATRFHQSSRQEGTR